jgi:Mn2+/Fe2+ NRAMP family transporter
MGPLVNRPFTSFLAWITTILILALNIYLLYSMAAGGD